MYALLGVCNKRRSPRGRDGRDKIGAIPLLLFVQGAPTSLAKPHRGEGAPVYYLVCDGAPTHLFAAATLFPSMASKAAVR